MFANESWYRKGEEKFIILYIIFEKYIIILCYIYYIILYVPAHPFTEVRAHLYTNNKKKKYLLTYTNTYIHRYTTVTIKKKYVARSHTIASRTFAL